MNLGSVASGIANSAGSAAGNAASGAANAASSTVGSSALKLDSLGGGNAVPSSSSPNLSNSGSNIVDFPGNSNPPVNNSGGAEIVDFPGNSNDTLDTGGADIVDFPGNDDSATPEPEGPKEGDKVDAGKEIGEDGQVEDSSTKKLLKGVGRGAAAYFTGGESLKVDQAALNNPVSDKLIGVVSDTAEAVPGVKEIADELDDIGLTDGVNNALDTAGNALNGDIKGTVDSAVKTVKDVDKMKKKMRQKIILAVAPFVATLLFVIIIFAVILGPVAGGFMDATAGDSVSSTNGSQAYPGAPELIGETPNFEELSAIRQAMITAAASAVGRPYTFGNHPNGAGLSGIPAGGLDCAGYVQWVIWTATGTNPGYLTTGGISSMIGGKFIKIDASEVLPGDIGLKRMGGSTDKDTNHTGIYAGNGEWYHASGKKTGIVKNGYKNFTIYLRYVGVS